MLGPSRTDAPADGYSASIITPPVEPEPRVPVAWIGIHSLVVLLSGIGRVPLQSFGDIVRIHQRWRSLLPARVEQASS